MPAKLVILLAVAMASRAGAASLRLSQMKKEGVAPCHKVLKDAQTFLATAVDKGGLLGALSVAEKGVFDYLAVLKELQKSPLAGKSADTADPHVKIAAAQRLLHSMTLLKADLARVGVDGEVSAQVKVDAQIAQEDAAAMTIASVHIREMLDASDGPNKCTAPTVVSQRMWFFCTGAPEPNPTATETRLGIKVGSSMSCTQEFSFDCLCCLDWTRPLPFDHFSVMSLDAAQKPKCSPGAMQHSTSNKGQNITLVCSSPISMKGIAGEAAAHTSVALPVECVRHEFTSEELHGSGTNSSGGVTAKLAQILLQTRTQILSQEGLAVQDVPACQRGTNHLTCPSLTPRFGLAPNSAEKKTSLLEKGLLATETNFGFGGMMTSGSTMGMSSGF